VATLESVIESVVTVIELAGVIVIVAGFALAMVQAIARYRRDTPQAIYVGFRHRIGRSLIIGLEFLIAADVISTITIDTTLTSVAELTAIILIRTFLSVMLHLEVEGRWPWQQPAAGPSSDEIP
jgi:uncharacterized membrane protein